MTSRHYWSVCKQVMRPVVRDHWNEEVWKRRMPITEFRQMADVLGGTGEEESCRLLDRLKDEFKLSDEEIFDLSFGDDPSQGYEVGERLHYALTADCAKAFGVLVRQAPSAKKGADLSWSRGERFLGGAFL